MFCSWDCDLLSQLVVSQVGLCKTNLNFNYILLSLQYSKFFEMFMTLVKIYEQSKEQILELSKNHWVHFTGTTRLKIKFSNNFHEKLSLMEHLKCKLVSFFFLISSKKKPYNM